jgi:hypothetical protein
MPPIFDILTGYCIVFSSGVVTSEQLDQLPTKVRDLMAKVRPHAVKLVDSWMIPDYLLDRYDISMVLNTTATTQC